MLQNKSVYLFIVHPVYYKVHIIGQLYCSARLILVPSGNQMLLISSYQNLRCDLYLGSVFDQHPCEEEGQSPHPPPLSRKCHLITGHLSATSW
jgi:hypothetical protein